MEKEEIINLAYEIKDELKKTPLISSIKQKEKELLDDKDIIPFIMAFKSAETEYNDAIRHNVKDLKSLEIKLSKAKEILYSQEKVKEYFELVNNAQKYLNDITDKMFSSLIDGLLIKRL